MKTAMEKMSGWRRRERGMVGDEKAVQQNKQISKQRKGLRQ